MYGRPRHLSHNRNMSLLNQIPFINNYLPYANGTGALPGMFNPQPGIGGGGWNNQTGGFSNFMDASLFNQGGQGIPLGNMPSQGFPFNVGAMNPGNTALMGQNGFPLSMQQGGIPLMQQQQGGFIPGVFPQGGVQQNGGFQPPQAMGMPFMNPYPTQNQAAKPQSSQVSSFMNQFKGQDGNVDMKKMMDTAGQMMNTVNQLNNMFKGLASTFKA